MVDSAEGLEKLGAVLHHEAVPPGGLLVLRV
jgi:hypothetical protein